MKKLAKIFLSIALVLIATFTYAQEVEMADKMRADGKIYVVVAIIMTILAGFILYLFVLDRKVGKLEKQLDAKQTKTK